jgi:hypothetical protein
MQWSLHIILVAQCEVKPEQQTVRHINISVTMQNMAWLTSHTDFRWFFLSTVKLSEISHSNMAMSTGQRAMGSNNFSLSPSYASS